MSTMYRDNGAIVLTSQNDQNGPLVSVNSAT